MSHYDEIRVVFLRVARELGHRIADQHGTRGVVARVAHEAQMSFMEKPHGRNENQTPPLAVLRLTPIFHLPNELNDLHGHRIRRADRPVALI